jgi:hypothetical protein
MNLFGSKLERKVNEKHTRNIREVRLNVPESKTLFNFSGDFTINADNISSIIFNFKSNVYTLILLQKPKYNVLKRNNYLSALNFWKKRSISIGGGYEFRS